MKSNPPKSIFRLLIAVSIIVVIVVAVLLILRSESTWVLSLSAARLASDPSLGSPSAKVTIIEYGDFGCTTCRGWEQAGA